ncbi:MAG: class I SAM-dependent methyltransferase [Rhodospirillaceae bacterium]
MSKEDFNKLLRKALVGPYTETDIGLSLFRTCLETMHAAYMKACNVVSPSLELGVGDGSSSMFINGEFGREISVGLDMPLGMTLETKGLWWHPTATHYRSFMGGNMENIPFADSTFSTVYTSETMFYGMDLEVTAREITRVLKPGGRFYCFNATDQWYAFEVVLNQLKTNIPTFSVPSDDTFVALFVDAGLSCEEHSYFFSPAMEILLHSIVDAGSGRTSAHSPLHLNSNNFEGKLDVLAELLSYETDLPLNGFHHFLSFQKPGQDATAGVRPFDPFNHLKCPKCQATVFSFEESTITCTLCGSSYQVVCGVPMMVTAEESGFSSIRLSEDITTGINQHLSIAANTATGIFNQYEKNVTAMLNEKLAKTLDIIVMAEHNFENKVPISRQTASALRYMFKRAHPELTISLRIIKEENDPFPPLEKSDIPVLALYLSGGAPIPKSLLSSVQARQNLLLYGVKLTS